MQNQCNPGLLSVRHSFENTLSKAINLGVDVHQSTRVWISLAAECSFSQNEVFVFEGSLLLVFDGSVTA